MIEFDDVSRSYGRKVAVDRLTLSVPAGQLFAFLGPNGAGKTTTIKMLVGLMRPGAGQVRVCGFDVARQTREACRNLGYVPDVPYLYDKLTGREFLQFIAGMHGLTADQTRRGLDEQVAAFELAEFLDHLTETYAHGMKQRLVFAGAMLHSPPVLVIDEPMVGLDPRSTRLVKDLLRAKVRAGVCVFMSTHLLDVAEQISDRVGIVARGRLLRAGTIAELRHEMARQHGTLEQLFLELTAESKAPAGSGAPEPPAREVGVGADSTGKAEA